MFTLNDFSGGLNTDKSTRALEDNELAECTNFDVSSKGKIVASRIFNSTALYGDQDNDGGGQAVAEHQPGYGLFAFSNDHTLAATPATFSGEFIVKMANTDVDILQVATTGTNSDVWYEASEYAGSGITSAAVKPAFYAAEGDLFIGGVDGSDAFVTPQSLVYHAQNQIPTATITDVNEWDVHTQDKTVPTSSDMKIYQTDSDGDGATVTAPGADKLTWIVKPDATASGLWSQDASAANDRIDYAGTYLYKNNTESGMYEMSVESTAHYEDWTEKAIYVQAWYSAAAGVTASSQALYGARLYARHSSESGDYYLLAELSLEKGIKGDGETEWTPWKATASGDNFDLAADTGDTATTGLISAPPALLTYKILNGYSRGDIPDSNITFTDDGDKDRIVNFKTGIIANSRAYIGNVKLNNRHHGDRILKSPVFQYDIFTENDYLDVAINDGDQITALAGYGDRILEFKDNAVYIINVSKELEFLEDEQQGAGAAFQAAVTETPFGIVWVNTNGCYLYDGEKISQLQLGKISASDWETNITSLATIGYDSSHQQVVVLWTADNGTNAYVFDAETGGWHKVSDIISGTSNTTNMVNARGDKLLVGGGAAHDDVNFLADRTGTGTGYSLKTKVFDLGNPESNKNLLEVAVVYRFGHADLDVIINTWDDGGTKTATTVGAIDVDDTNPDTAQFDTSGTAALQGNKVYQIEIAGTSNEDVEINSISLTYRDIGVH